MNKIDLRKLQLIQLDAFQEVDRICKKYNLAYYMIAGTLIGAVRHKGFIPWDDDIDIAMLRSDYDRFLNCCASELTDKYFVQNYRTDTDFYPALTRICIKGTYLDDKYAKHLKFKKEAYIDIFPLDNVPDDEEMMEKHGNRIMTIDRIMSYKACLVYRKGPFYSKLIGKKLLKMLLLPISLNSLQRCREKAMKEYSNQTTSRVCSTATMYSYKKHVMQRSSYENGVLLEFEGGMYYAPREWDTYLKQIYGDYMMLPPEEMRKPSFDVYEV
ncbi:MAG: LicD family protein [Desulfosporosinus sp.]|nr:LicD family protein [Desulfosporosinus sp.]